MGHGMTCSSSKTNWSRLEQLEQRKGFAPVGETPLKGGSHQRLEHALARTLNWSGLNLFACLCGVRIETPRCCAPRCWDCGRVTSLRWVR